MLKKVAAALAALACFGASSVFAAGENVTGKWSGLVSLPLVPSSAALLKNGKVLLWSADGEFSFSSAGEVKTVIYDPATGAQERRSAAVGHNMFCTGTTLLADGRLLVNGGSNAPVTSIFDPENRSFARDADMVIPRGYNGNTLLSDGSVLTLGGSWGGDLDQRKDGELWTPGSGWRALPGVTPAGMTSSEWGFAKDSHFALIPTGNGRVLYAAPGPMMKWIDTGGTGGVKDAGLRGDDGFASSGNAVMYAAGRILKTGGSALYSGAPASAKAYDIDVASGAAVVTKQPAMIYPRVYHNSVVLPDGKVMLVGGQTYGQGFSDSNSVLATEIWDPARQMFTAAAPTAVGRNYHSVALLLPDARVLSGGGGLCGRCSADHPDLQLFSPGYLFNADGSPASRPAILSAPEELGYGRPITVTTDRAVASFALVRMGATTHTVNADQRRLELRHSALAGGGYRVEVPSNAGYLLPGYWMLFAMDAAGTPSVAKIVHVGVNGVATLVAPEPVLAQSGAAVDVRPRATPLDARVRFSAAGLPDGLSVAPLTGAITGVPTRTGLFRTSLIATLGDQSVSTDFVMTVDPGPADGEGLLGEYFAGAGLAGPVVAARREAVNQIFAEAGPGAGVPGVFSARWRGELLASRGGATRFRVEADDGVRLWIDGKLIADDWTIHGPTAYEGQVDLVAGARSRIFLEYFNSGGAGLIRLSWLRPGDADFSPIPASELFASATTATANRALGRTATQSSTYEGAAAARAVDGVTNGAFPAGSVAHTDIEDRPWWQVDLQGSAQLDFVRIWKRTDCCDDRAQNLTVFVSSADMGGRSYGDLVADPAVSKRSFGASVIPGFIDAPIDGRGRFVRVQATARTYLNLAEVEVFGGAAGRQPVLATPASQTSQAGIATSLALIASDPDGDVLAFAASGLPAGLAIDAATGRISGAPTVAGSYAVTARATDPSGLSAEASFAWTVTPGVPRVTKLVVRPAKVAQSVLYAPTIANGAGATFSWRFGDGSPDTAFSTSARVRKAFASAGVFNVTLLLKASNGAITTYAFDQAVYQATPSDARGGASAGAGYETRPGAAARLWVANPDNDSVGVIDLGTNRLVAEIPVGRSPQSVLVTGSGAVWVANRGSGTISIVDSGALTVSQTVTLARGSRPGGLALAGPEGQVVASLEGLGQVALFGAGGQFYGAADVGPTPRHLATNAAKTLVYVSRFVTGPLPGESTAKVLAVDAAGKPVGGEVRVVNLSGAVEKTVVLGASRAVDTEASGRGVPNYVGGLAIAPDGRIAWAPSKQDNVFRGTLRDGQNLTFETSVRAVVSRIDLATGLEDPAQRIDLDNAGVASAATMHPTGAYLFVALQNINQVAVVDPVGRREIFRFRVGRAPSTLTLSPDGNVLLVGNMIDRSVSVVDLAPLLAAGQKRVVVKATVRTIVTEKLAANVLRGKRLFYDAADTRLARDGYLSCASCHDQGESDGRIWDFTGMGEGLRNTTTLLGKGGTAQGFLHWTANFDEVQDFEGQIRSFAGGTGLMSDALFLAGTRRQPLGAKKAGLSADLDALAAYLASLAETPASPHAAPGGGLTAAGAAGKAAFDRLGCAGCHGGPQLTSSAGVSALKNVGTSRPASGKRLGAALTGFDVPTLRGVWATAPYLHDGSAPTLAAAVQAHKTLSVSAADRDALAAYLREIGPP